MVKREESEKEAVKKGRNGVKKEMEKRQWRRSRDGEKEMEEVVEEEQWWRRGGGGGVGGWTKTARDSRLAGHQTPLRPDRRP